VDSQSTLLLALESLPALALAKACILVVRLACALVLCLVDLSEQSLAKSYCLSCLCGIWRCHMRVFS